MHEFNKCAMIFLGSIFTNNIILIKMLGLCPFLGSTKSNTMAIGIGLATSFVIISSELVSYLIYKGVLLPCKIEYLRTLVFIVSIAGIVQFTESFLNTFHPLLHQALGIYLPLITTNCAVLGVILLNIAQEFNLLESLIFGLGASIGFTMAMIIVSKLRNAINYNDIPKYLRGNAIVVISIAILSMAFTGFNGIYRAV